MYEIDRSFSNALASAAARQDLIELMRVRRNKYRELRIRFPEAAAFLGLDPAGPSAPLPPLA